MKYININLLGPEAQRSSGLAIPAGVDIDPVLIGIGAGGLLVAFAVPHMMAWGVDSFLNGPADQRIRAQEEEIKKNASGSQLLVERQKELQGLESDYQALQGLVGVGGTWASILEELRAITPTDLWLTEFKTDGGRIELAGSALDYKAVAYFYTNFQNSRNFAGPVLNAVSEESGTGRATVRFSLRATIVTPGISGS